LWRRGEDCWFKAKARRDPTIKELEEEGGVAWKEEGRKRGSHIGTVEKRPWEGHPETHPFLVAAQPNRLLRTATAATGIGGREGAQDNDLLPYFFWMSG
jgi:hypothetical protein